MGAQIPPPVTEIGSVDGGPGGEPVYGGDPKGWPDTAFPMFNGKRARPYAAGGNFAQHKAHVDRLKAFQLLGVKTAAQPPSTIAASTPPATVLGNPGQTISFFGGQFSTPQDYADMSESMYDGGMAATTQANGGFTGDSKLWPDSAFPVWEGTVARPLAAGGTRAQHAAHIARLEGLKAKGIKTEGVAPSSMGGGGMSDTVKYALIAGGVVVAGFVVYKMTRPTQRTGLAGLYDKGRKAIGV